ncbi:MAG: acyl-CoA dehydrogenase family protein [Myxococcota bacterium]
MSITERALERLNAALPTITDLAVDTDRSAAFPGHAVRALTEAGLMGLVTPVAHGGLGGTAGDAAAVVERVARACGSSAMILAMHYCGAAVIAAHGSPEVNRAVAAGEHLSTLAFSEVGSRSAFWAPVSTARADGDQVVLDAQKSWVTSASYATAYVWSSKPVAADGPSTVWLVERSRAGIEVPGEFDGLGLRGNDSSPLTAREVRVPATNRLGPDGGGFDVMMGVVLPMFNLLNAACSIGLCEGALAGAAAHLGATRFQHTGEALSALPTVRAYYAKARLKTDLVRCLWTDTMAAMASGRPDTMLRVLEVKAAAGEAALEVTATAMRVCGGAAYRKELGVERAFRDAQASSVMAPTADVLYDFIGKATLGLPLFG